MSDWKWYTAFAPSIGWDMAFQASPDLLATLESKDAPDRFRVRRPSKLEVTKGKTTPDPVLTCTRWMPGFFGALGKDGEAVVGRNLFVWVAEATPEAAADWDEAWEPKSGLVVVDEATGEQATKALAAEAKAKSDLAKHLRAPHLKKV